MSRLGAGIILSVFVKINAFSKTSFVATQLRQLGFYGKNKPTNGDAHGIVSLQRGQQRHGMTNVYIRGGGISLPVSPNPMYIYP